MRIKNIHVAISAVCAVAGVLIAAIQTFGHSDAVPVEVKVELNPQKNTGEQTQAETVNADVKSNNAPITEKNLTEIAQSEPAGFAVAALDRARFLPATRQDTTTRFALPVLFDGNPATYLKILAPETDIDFIVEFPASQPLAITGVQIDTGEVGAVAPAKLEITILPSGGMEGSGRAVASFDIRPEGGIQKFTFPALEGKGAWIRIAARSSAEETIIGDLQLITTAKQ
jgi:hypothetical protein